MSVNQTLETGLLLGLHGVAQVGKDTVADYLVNNRKFHRIANGDYIRRGLLGINPWIVLDSADHKLLRQNTPDRKQLEFLVKFDEPFLRLSDIVDMVGWEIAKQIPEVRRLLQTYGTEGGRYVHGMDCWNKLVYEEAALYHDVLISDVRFEDELQAVKDHGGLNIKITRKGVSSVNGHVSDKGLDDKYFDFIIRNDGSIEELYSRIERLVISAYERLYV